jgi:hypothetical protein
VHLRHKARLGIWDDRFLIDHTGHRHPGDVSRAVRLLIMRGVAAGLVVTSTTDGKHTPSSHHYPRNSSSGLGEAVDLGPGKLAGTERGRRRMVGFQRREARRPERYREIFGPDNAANVKNGRVMSLVEGTSLETAHDTHFHGSPKW